MLPIPHMHKEEVQNGYESFCWQGKAGLLGGLRMIQPIIQDLNPGYFPFFIG
jgi:hypothetical protein